ncbi:Integrator complex subunit 8, partial [Quaeritorhiza haematococci]
NGRQWDPHSINERLKSIVLNLWDRIGTEACWIALTEHGPRNLKIQRRADADTSKREPPHTEVTILEFKQKILTQIESKELDLVTTMAPLIEQNPMAFIPLLVEQGRWLYAKNSHAAATQLLGFCRVQLQRMPPDQANLVSLLTAKIDHMLIETNLVHFAVHSEATPNDPIPQELVDLMSKGQPDLLVVNRFLTALMRRGSEEDKNTAIAYVHLLQQQLTLPGAAVQTASADLEDPVKVATLPQQTLTDIRELASQLAAWLTVPESPFVDIKIQLEHFGPFIALSAAPETASTWTNPHIHQLAMSVKDYVLATVVAAPVPAELWAVLKQIYTLLTKLAPNDPKNLLCLADVHFAAGEYPQAMKLYLNAMSLRSSFFTNMDELQELWSSRFVLRIVSCCGLTNEHVAAAIFLQLQQPKPDYSLAFTALQRGQFQKAERYGKGEPTDTLHVTNGCDNNGDGSK